MSGFSDRTFWLLEGFNYASTAQYKQVHTSFNGTVNLDSTTIPGRKCVSVSSGGYTDVVLPRYDAEPWSTELLWSQASQNFVFQAKVYLDVASYTNLLTNGFLAEIWSGTDIRWGFGLSPNTSVNQDNFYMTLPDQPTSNDYATMNPQYVPPSIPERTLTDIKLVWRTDGSRTGHFQLFINNFLVAYQLWYGNEADNLGAYRRFRGVRLYGLANQTGPTLWSDVMFYKFYDADNYRTSALPNTLNIIYTSSAYTNTAYGSAFVPMNARVYDITPETTDGGINQFITLGTGSALTALSGLDTNQYVVSSAANQAFRLKVGEPDEATGDGSTPIVVTDRSEVLAVSYRMHGKDLAGLGSSVYMAMSDEANNYRFRYYKIRISESEWGNNNGSYINKVQFLNTSLARLEFPVGTTMRFRGVNDDTLAWEYLPWSGRAYSNTSQHTLMLTTGGSSQDLNQSQVDYCGLSFSWNKGWYADYIIDCGVGNIGPDWYAMSIYYPGDYRRIPQNTSLYGSNDGVTWYTLGDIMGRVNDNYTAYIYNRRHPDYTQTNINGRFRNVSGIFQQNASQYTGYNIVVTGDPIAGGTVGYPYRTPPSWAQFKNYKIGFGEA